MTALTLRLKDLLLRGGESAAEAAIEEHIFQCKLIPLVQRGAEDPAWQVK